MSFRVVGNLSFRPASTSEHKTAEEALAKAMELMGYGLTPALEALPSARGSLTASNFFCSAASSASRVRRYASSLQVCRRTWKWLIFLRAIKASIIPPPGLGPRRERLSQAH
jgi:hypothetical protein